jgi:hypothetical protein
MFQPLIQAPALRSPRIQTVAKFCPPFHPKVVPTHRRHRLAKASRPTQIWAVSSRQSCRAMVSTPINVDNWFFNYGGVSGIADGNAINLQPQGRWVIVGALMYDGTLEGRTIPGDLLVLKDAQGRVYRPNADASEAFLNTYPGSYNINLKQAAPVAQNFAVPLLFDVAPDATDLVLFSPQFTDQGYYVRANAQ